MALHANVDEAEIGRVVVGQDASFTVDSYPARAFPGRLVDIRKMPQTTQNVVTYTVVISADNEDLLLLPGMTANVRIPGAAARSCSQAAECGIALSARGCVPASRPMTSMADPTPSYLLRAALDRIELADGRGRSLSKSSETPIALRLTGMILPR
jgi:hypothetical protein